MARGPISANELTALEHQIVNEIQSLQTEIDTIVARELVPVIREILVGPKPQAGGALEYHLNQVRLQEKRTEIYERIYPKLARQQTLDHRLRDVRIQRFALGRTTVGQINEFARTYPTIANRFEMFHERVRKLESTLDPAIY